MVYEKRNTGRAALCVERTTFGTIALLWRFPGGNYVGVDCPEDPTFGRWPTVQAAVDHARWLVSDVDCHPLAHQVRHNGTECPEEWI